MELPDRIENFTKEQIQHLDMLVDQLDAMFPIDRMDEERLAKDPHLAILPSGMKLSTKDVLNFEMPASPRTAWVYYGNGSGPVAIYDQHDVAAFNAALNDIGVYVSAPTIKGDDADGDGIHSEGAPV
jgi:hypothetical protein